MEGRLACDPRLRRPMLYTAAVSGFRLQRAISVLSAERHANRADAGSYWRSRPPEERLAAVEFLRNQMYGPGARLQRILRVTERSRR